MSMPDTSAEFFEAMFHDSADPWNFAADGYEQFRYNTILKALQPGPYHRAFEPGCSVGALTEKLATIANRVDACDFSPTAVQQAQDRCRNLPGVKVHRASITDPTSYAGYDLVVLSEIGYYFPATTWQTLVKGIVEGMQPGAVLLASHWLGKSPDHILNGDEVHSLMQSTQLRHEHGERHVDDKRGGFRLDRWSKVL